MGTRLKGHEKSCCAWHDGATRYSPSACISTYTPVAARRAPPSCQRSRRIFHGLYFLKDMLQRLWRGIRQLSGDDAYERYLAHHAACHVEAQLLTRREFFLRREQQKWGGIKRCC